MRFYLFAIQPYVETLPVRLYSQRQALLTKVELSHYAAI